MPISVRAYCHPSGVVKGSAVVLWRYDVLFWDVFPAGRNVGTTFRLA